MNLFFGPSPLGRREMTDTEWATANAQAGRPATWRPGQDKPAPPPAARPSRCKCCGGTVQWFVTVSQWICAQCNTRPEPMPKPPGYVEPELPTPKSLSDKLLALRTQDALSRAEYQSPTSLPQSSTQSPQDKNGPDGQIITSDQTAAEREKILEDVFK